MRFMFCFALRATTKIGGGGESRRRDCGRLVASSLEGLVVAIHCQDIAVYLFGLRERRLVVRNLRFSPHPPNTKSGLRRTRKFTNMLQRRLAVSSGSTIPPATKDGLRRTRKFTKLPDGHHRRLKWLVHKNTTVIILRFHMTVYKRFLFLWQSRKPKLPIIAYQLVIWQCVDAQPLCPNKLRHAVRCVLSYAHEQSTGRMSRPLYTRT